MVWIVRNLWLIPALPSIAAAFIAFAKQRRRGFAATLAIGSMGLSFLLSLCALAHTFTQTAIEFINFPWLQFGSEWLKFGWLLDPLTAVMLVMVTFVSLLIFIYSVGYMSHDENFTRFFCFLSLFAGAMLGVVIANSLLLLFMCWEIVGLTSYLLIGFWYQRPAAAAAAKKAFIVTRIGDVGLFLGMLWLYSRSGTLLFYDHGTGCLEHSALTAMAGASTGIALLIFCGAAGKSGQFPLHVWLPDAMEGPTPVSALIHAATMVAAGVFLVARVYPLMTASAASGGPAPALEVVTWVGAITALFAACIAVAQNDIKRILAYSTVSQLGYMMMGLGVGGVAVGMFHLITHAFFKALLFLGAGSVIHGCAGEQDIRNMGGLRKLMPITFATYAVGMLALCGVPLFSGFWSKDEILHAAHLWSVSGAPFYIGATGALLTAFYMTRQVYYVFFGERREPPAHESPAVVTAPLVILAVFAALLGFIGTPAWPWFQGFLERKPVAFGLAQFTEAGILPLMAASSITVFAGLALGWWLYGRSPIASDGQVDALEKLQPGVFRVLSKRLYVDEFFGLSVIRIARWSARLSSWMDRWVWNGAVRLVSWLVIGTAQVDSLLDTLVVNTSFDEGCKGFVEGGRLMSRLQNGRVQSYLRVIGIALVAFAIFLFWGRKG
jgi:NADH-quinone oxidoreductase subunit L